MLLLPRLRVSQRRQLRLDRLFGALALLGLALGSAACGKSGEAAPHDRLIGLSTSLPLVWGESGDIRGQLARSDPSHWSIAVLERRGRVVPLDSLAGPSGRLPLPVDATLVLVQPHPLSPDENVALDAWVRAGGHLLLFADPMLTADSHFALGDPRRPQTIAMLSPILRHWGLELEFAEDQPAGERSASALGVSLPVDLPGRLRSGAGAFCSPDPAGLAADCAIGKGRAVIVADAAVFDGEDAGRSAALAGLLALISR